MFAMNDQLAEVIIEIVLLLILIVLRFWGPVKYKRGPVEITLPPADHRGSKQ